MSFEKYACNLLASAKNDSTIDDHMLHAVQETETSMYVHWLKIKRKLEVCTSN